MKVTYNKNDIILDGVQCLDLDLTLDCGQAFRWVKQEDDSWSGVAGGRFLNIARDGDRIILRNTGKEDLTMLCIQYKANAFTEADSPMTDGVILQEPLNW